MLAVLRLEAIGSTYNDQVRAMAGQLDCALGGNVPTALRLKLRAPWVARIVGPDPKWGLKREFVGHKRDYAEANGFGSRGVMHVYLLPPGVYEARELVSWARDRRYFVRSEAGALSEISREEVDAWINRVGSGA